MTVLSTITHILRAIWRITRRIARITFRVAYRLVLLIVFLLVLGNGEVRDVSLQARVTALARPDLFDYVSWEVHALWGKAGQQLFGVEPYLPDQAQHDQVIDYLQRLSDLQDVEAEIERLYTDPTVSDPVTASASLRAQRDRLRDALAADQPLVESIIEAQVSAVLVDGGFDTLGQVLPPVSMHFSELPMTLVVSPRDRIEFAAQLELNPLTVDQSEALESTIDTRLNVSSLVVPLGGLSLYPSMIIEPEARDLPSKVARAFEVTAHEWSHHYLIFFPLGFEYDLRPETRIINETTATFFGHEIAQQVMQRYYPDLPTPVYPSFLNPPAPPANSGGAPMFDFAAEMNTTRTHVDELLAAGKIDEAEAYMEARRRVFVANGYAIRKLNQAYFAFYGGYQDEPGAGGTDPTGPAIEEMRLLSPDLRAWLQTMRGITTRDQLLAALDRARVRKNNEYNR
jgi:hypothetical protein